MNKEQFRKHRKTLDITQTKYGQLLGGYSQEHISRIETGVKFISDKLARDFELLILSRKK